MSAETRQKRSLQALSQQRAVQTTFPGSAPHQVKLWLGQEFTAGLLAGAVADGLLYPMDTLRARLQVKVVRTGMVRELIEVVRVSGVRALYKGLPLQMVASGPGCGIFYCTYEHLQAVLKPWISNKPSRCSAAAAVACFVSLAVFTPVEVIKQRTMVANGAGSVSVLRAMLLKHGPLGFFEGGRGLSGVLTSVPYSAIYFLVYESLLSQRASVHKDTAVSFRDAVWYGMAAGVAAASLTTPCDVVRTRLQVGGALCPGAMLPPGGWAGMASHIAKTEGWRGFSRGVMPRVVLLAPASAITIATYGWWLQAIA